MYMCVWSNACSGLPTCQLIYPDQGIRGGDDAHSSRSVCSVLMVGPIRLSQMPLGILLIVYLSILPNPQYHCGHTVAPAGRIRLGRPFAASSRNWNFVSCGDGEDEAAPGHVQREFPSLAKEKRVI
jgi:hypothetical protein